MAGLFLVILFLGFLNSMCSFLEHLKESHYENPWPNDWNTRRDAITSDADEVIGKLKRQNQEFRKPRAEKQ